MFKPPAETGAMSFTLKVKLTDTHPSRPKTESYSISVRIEGESFVPDFSVREKILEEIRRQKKRADDWVPKKLKIEMDKPTNSGKFKVNFGGPLALPAGIQNWNSHNEGGSEYFKVIYQQSDESLDILEESDLDMSFEWSVESIDFVDVDGRRRAL